MEIFVFFYHVPLVLCKNVSYCFVPNFCNVDQVVCEHLGRYRNRPVMSGPGLYDPTSIMNHEVLSQCQREGWVKLAFYLLAFFYYLYGSVSTYDSCTFHEYYLCLPMWDPL